jgi:UDP-glucose 4-epimerase
MYSSRRAMQVVCAASSSYYGDTPTLPKVETMPANPQSPYALQKFVGEKYATMFYKLYGLETVALRYFNIFGPRQDPTSEYSAVIPRFIRMLKEGEPVTIFGDGTGSRDFTFVSDAVQANLRAAIAPGVAGEVFNCAGGRQVTLNELVETLQKMLGTSVTPTYLDPRAGDIKHSYADISKAGAMLGWTPAVPFEEGLERTISSIN